MNFTQERGERERAWIGRLSWSQLSHHFFAASMKISGNPTAEDGWKTVRNKRSGRSGNSRSLLNKNGLCFWIEAKGFPFSKGYGSKSGQIQIMDF